MFYQDLIPNLTDWLLTHGVKIAIVLISTFIGLKVLHTFINRVVRRTVDRTLGIREGDSLDKRVDTLDGVFFAAIKVVAWLIVGMVILAEFDIEIGPLLAAGNGRCLGRRPGSFAVYIVRWGPLPFPGRP